VGEGGFAETLDQLDHALSRIGLACVLNLAGFAPAGNSEIQGRRLGG
jgi:hypothetical protein